MGAIFVRPITWAEHLRRMARAEETPGSTHAKTKCVIHLRRQTVESADLHPESTRSRLWSPCSTPDVVCNRATIGRSTNHALIRDSQQPYQSQKQFKQYTTTSTSCLAHKFHLAPLRLCGISKCVYVNNSGKQYDITRATKH